MPAQREPEVFKKACEEVARLGFLGPEQFKRLSELFGKRFQTAYKALEEGRVKRYVFNPSGRVVWVVVGREKDYEVLPEAGFCSCEDFYFKVVEGKVSLCYHVIAQRLAEATTRFSLIKETDDVYDGLMREWRKPELKLRRPSYLRVIEDIRKAVAVMLEERGGLGSSEIYMELAFLGYETPSVRHLVAALKFDPEERFKYVNGVWAVKAS